MKHKQAHDSDGKANGATRHPLAISQPAGGLHSRYFGAEGLADGAAGAHPICAQTLQPQTATDIGGLAGGITSVCLLRVSTSFSAIKS